MKGKGERKKGNADLAKKKRKKIRKVRRATGEKVSERPLFIFGPNIISLAPF